MRHKTLFYIILSFLLLSTFQSPAHAGSAANWVKKGNQAYETKKYDAAVKDYDRAGVEAPESALIDFNKGAAFYRGGDWDKARDAWSRAAQKAKSPLLTARALYNLGNCGYKMAMRQKDSDMGKAVNLCTQSIRNYQKALDQLSSIKNDSGKNEKHPELKKNTAKNIEIVRLVLKSMMDEIAHKKADAKKARASANTLRKLIDRQKELINRNQYFAQEKGAGQKKNKEISNLAGDQKKLAEDTDKAADAMSGRGGKNAGTSPGAPHGNTGPMAAAKGLLKKAVKDQTIAAKKIENKKLSDAGPDQAAALADMEKALKSLSRQANAAGTKSENKQKGEQKQAGKKGEQNKSAKQNKQKRQTAKKENKQQNGQNTAEKIIEQERERRNNENQSSSGGYFNVDKNW